MEDRKILLARGSERNISFVSECCGYSLYASFASPLRELAAGARARQKRDPHFPASPGRTSSRPAAARAFLAQYVSPAVLEVFPEWQGILIESPALEGAVWVVHGPQYGRQLVSETGKPAILLAAILAQQGRPLEETREALAPLLIIPAEKRHRESPGVQRSKEDKRLTMQGDTAAKTAGAIHGNEGVGGCSRKGGKIP